MTDPDRRLVVHPAVLAALWDYGASWRSLSTRYQQWLSPDGPSIVLLDSVRRDVLDRLRRDLVGWQLDSQIASHLAEDVTEALQKLASQRNVELIPTAPLLSSAFVVATSLEVDLEDAMCLFVASAIDGELLLLDHPRPALLRRIRGRLPGFKYSTVT